MSEQYLAIDGETVVRFLTAGKYCEKDILVQILKGLNGTTFTPDVSEDGVISWTNSGELPNPAPVNIKGPKGDAGKSVTVSSVSESTADGGENVVKFSDGNSVKIKNGSTGKDGYTPVKNKDYFDGTSVTITKTTESDVSGGENEVVFSNGSSLTVKNGKDGKDGTTPEKGKDYFTEADKAEMVTEVINALPVYDGEVVAV